MSNAITFRLSPKPVADVSVANNEAVFKCRDIQWSIYVTLPSHLEHFKEKCKTLVQGIQIPGNSTQDEVHVELSHLLTKLEQEVKEPLKLNYNLYGSPILEVAHLNRCPYSTKDYQALAKQQGIFVPEGLERLDPRVLLYFNEERSKQIAKEFAVCQLDPRHPEYCGSPCKVVGVATPTLKTYLAFLKRAMNSSHAKIKKSLQKGHIRQAGQTIAEALHRSFDIPDELFSEDFTVSITDRSFGVLFQKIYPKGVVHPQGEAALKVRIMAGNFAALHLSQRNPYVRISAAATTLPLKFYDAAGRPGELTAPDTHIALKDFHYSRVVAGIRESLRENLLEHKDNNNKR
ncbi:MAG: hypothetical protein ACD_17C00155G0003 [uncultured bacterium]|nr:MAG: hypothetical protein ACD_17C00155G0003 [uncultured bacterium]OGN56954.1 MAG: hypothetical protein A2796_06505 [Chlamydiae bacterium RIFCSPHIGHO2_01_FULL_44_39]OGN57634.1 MAG: hypothetical protein A3C42_04250 [Chlamydiae bacterium RIFCSPHIGHO2_02_FULL_45_9]OGN59647.1 MAG: hypothetical protein A3D96_06380 [Chlamydiae bacterium RIFCSPHIGHO2_12_FULL_44_59]OGN65737.1 MAG: hypothetical protein A2978_07375 [Chlamydiae bacterium RIFCSPLOWO2_01_FULL_44_52]OGN67879.1 MAG: hypothetical protein A3